MTLVIAVALMIYGYPLQEMGHIVNLHKRFSVYCSCPAWLTARVRYRFIGQIMGGFLFSLKESLVLSLSFLTIFLHFPQPFNFFAYFCCKNINKNMNNNTYEKP